MYGYKFTDGGEQRFIPWSIELERGFTDAYDEATYNLPKTSDLRTFRYEWATWFVVSKEEKKHYTIQNIGASLLCT